MTYFKILPLLLCCVIVNLFSQSTDSVSIDPLTNHLAYSSPATILPYFSIGLGASTIPYGTANPEYRGYVFVNVQDVGELSVNNEEFISDYNGSFLKSPLMSKIKMKLFSETQRIPAISFSFQTMFAWESIRYYSIVDRPDWAAQGLEELQYDYSIYTATINASKEITNGFEVSLGAGIKNIQFKNIVMFTATTIEWNWNRYDKPGLTKNIISYGYFNGQYAINDRLTIYGEIQNYPSLEPDLTNKNIRINQSYLIALGARLSISKGICINACMRKENLRPSRSGRLQPK